MFKIDVYGGFSTWFDFDELVWLVSNDVFAPENHRNDITAQGLIIIAIFQFKLPFRAAAAC